MITIKKIAFAPLFLISFALLIYQFNPLLRSYEFIFSLSSNTFIQLCTLAILFWLSSYLFILFSTLAGDWKITLPVGTASAASAFLLMDPALAPVFLVANISGIFLVSITFLNSLQNYLDFRPGKILGPAIKLLSTFLIFSFCVVYFLSISKTINQNGFQVPDSLIDPILQISTVGQPVEDLPPPQFPQINPEQLEFLKQNPEALKQFGIDPATLDFIMQMQLSSADQKSTGNTVKEVVQNQLQMIIKPYINFIPAVLAALLFLLIHLYTSVLNIFLTPLLMLTFFILGKTGYTKYEIETREVKKLVV